MRFRLLVLSLLLFGCDLRFGAIPTPTLAPTATPAPTVTVVFVKDGDLYAWPGYVNAALKIASSGVIQPFLAPDGKHVAFTRGQQGDKSTLWMIGIDGVGETELVRPQDLRSIRNGHPQIDQVKWLDNTTVYFNTYQQVESRSFQSDDLYRAEAGSDPQLILPAGAGGDFAISPNGQHIAVVRAGVYDTQKGQVALLDPLGVKVENKLTFTALRPPDQAPFYLPLAWSEDSAFVRVPVPSPDNDRVALWKIPVEGEAAIFGYISALLNGLPAWSANQMVYTRESSQPGMTDLLVADANGENEQVYDSGDLSHPFWLPDGVTFAYKKDRGLGLGVRGSSRGYMDFPRLRFLTHGYYIFVLSGYIGYKTANTDIEGIYPPVPEDVLFDAVVTP